MNILRVASQTLICLLVPAAFCYGQDAELEKTQRFNAVVRQYVNLSFQDADTHRQLQQLAQKGEINILADATRFGEQPQTLTIEEEDSLGMWIRKIAHEQNLSWRRQGERTFLFWSQPDIPALAQALADDPQANLVATPDAEMAKEDWRFLHIGSMTNGLTPPRGYVGPNLSAVNVQKLGEAKTEDEYVRAYIDMMTTPDFSEVVSEKIADYLEQSRGWSRKTRNFSLDLHLSQFPAPLSGEIKGLVLNRLIAPPLKNYKPWFSDATWQQARLGIRFNTGEIPVVTLTVAVPQGAGKQPLEERLALWPDRPEAQRLLPPRPRNPRSVSRKMPVSPAGLVQNVTRGASDVFEALDHDPKLDVPITLDIRDQPLPEFLNQVQKQGKVVIGLAPDSDLSKKRVTSVLKAMPLKSLMTALSRLYRSDWKPQGEGYELRSDTRSAAQRAVFSRGQQFRHWQEPMNQHNAPARLTLEELPDWQGDFEMAGLGEAIVSPQGMAFGDVPAELAAKVKRAVQTQVGLQLIDTYAISEVLGDDPLVRVRPGRSQAPPRIVAPVNIPATDTAQAEAPAKVQPGIALFVTLWDEYDYQITTFKIDEAARQLRKQQEAQLVEKLRGRWQQRQESLANRNKTLQGQPR